MQKVIVENNLKNFTIIRTSLLCIQVEWRRWQCDEHPSIASSNACWLKAAPIPRPRSIRTLEPPRCKDFSNSSSPVAYPWRHLGERNRAEKPDIHRVDARPISTDLPGWSSRNLFTSVTGKGLTLLLCNLSIVESLVHPWNDWKR